VKIDLHTHTTRSDGNTPPRELVRLAREAGIGVLAVTDHDTTEALEECLDEGARRGVRVLPGIELSSRFEGKDVHVLGYGFDPAAPTLRERLEDLHRRRRERVTRICARLADVGLVLEPQEVLREAGGKSVGRRHVARALVRKGAVGSLQEAFGRYLGADSPAYVPAHEMTPREARDLVRAHGGLAVLAHPGFLEDDALVERLLDEARFDGIEVFHRYDSATRHRTYLEMARRRNLLVTGGSDFHGDLHPRNAPLGEMTCPREHWKAFEKRLRAQ
jgi:hypothetical protein